LESEEGFPGLARTYGLEFPRRPAQMALGLLYPALESHQVDLIAGNSTDGLIAALGAAVLEDDRHYFPPYEAESWLRVQNYRSMDWKELVTLWHSYNRILLGIIENIDESALENVWVKGEDALPLNFIVKDYYRHLQWHIGHFEGRLKEVQA
jgi:hypothetical protein